MNVSNRVICIPRKRNPRSRGSASRSVGSADAISSYRAFIGRMMSQERRMQKYEMIQSTHLLSRPTVATNI
jgi:hypothetical protein